MTFPNKAAVATIEGYAAIFGRPDLSGDVVLPGAFSSKLIPGKSPSVMMLYQHTADTPIGKWTEVREDGYGLYVKGHLLLETPRGDEVYKLIRSGTIDGLSIGFKTRKARARTGSKTRRELLDVDLWEVSIVTFPMAPGARILRVS